MAITCSATGSGTGVPPDWADEPPPSKTSPVAWYEPARAESAPVAKLLDSKDEQLRVAALNALAALGDAALVPLPDPRLGQVIALVASGADEPAVAALQQAFHERVLPFERARAVHHLASLPRTPLGKLRREEVLRQLGVE